MQLPLHFSLTVIGILLITGCQSLDTHPTDLNAYLQQFIGQNSTDIQKNLDFKALGYKMSHEVEVSQDTLSYTILQPLNIPMSGVNPTVVPDATGIPVIRYNTSATPTYDIHFNCKITFKFKDEIAQSVQYLGKAC